MNVSKERKIFYGWYIVAAGFICMWINAGIGFYAFPVFFTELSENLGWGRGAINLGMSVSMVMGGLTSPLVGLLVPRYGSRRVIIVGALIMSAAFVLFSLMQTLWQYYLICFVLAVGWSFTGTIPTSYSVSNWFERKRGRAMGIMLVGVGLGGLTFAPLTRWLVDRVQWQTAFMIYAVFISVVLIPVAGAFFKRRPAEEGILPDGDSPDDVPDKANAQKPLDLGPTSGWELRDAARTRAFWIIAAAFILATFGQTALLLNQVTYFQDIGITPAKATRALGLCAMLGITGKLFFGAMADRYAARYAMVLCFGLQAVGTIVLLLTPMLGSPYWFVLLWGFAMGGVIALEPLIVAECFGLKSYGVILGIVYVLTTLGSAAGPPFAGFISDIGESYVPAFVVFVITYAVASILSFLAIPPCSPEGSG